MTALAAHEKQHTEAYDSARLTYVRELGTAKPHPNTLLATGTKFIVPIGSEIRPAGAVAVVAPLLHNIVVSSSQLRRRPLD